MKIICMDCQTESHVDPEMVKGKKHIECDHCAEEFRVNSESKMIELVPLTADEDMAVNTNSVHEPLPEEEVQWLDDEDVLDISVVPFAPTSPEPMKADDLISLAPDETIAAPLVEENFAPQPSQLLASDYQESPAQSLPEADVVCEASTHSAPLETYLPAEDFSGLSDEAKKVKVATFSVPRLLAVAAAFILFISLAGTISSPVGEVSLKAQTPAQAAVNPPAEKTVQPTAAPPVEVVETPQPTPSASPVVSQEATPPSTTAPVAEPIVNESAVPDDGKLTVQVGSHNQMNLADVQAEKLKAAGHVPRVVSVEIPKRGRWYRVQVGSFSDRQEAQSFGAQLVSKGVVESFVIADK